MQVTKKKAIATVQLNYKLAGQPSEGEAIKMTSGTRRTGNRHATTRYPRKAIGRAGWAYDSADPADEAELPRCFLRSPTEALLEFEWDGWVHTMPFKSQDGFVFNGDHVARKGGEQSRVEIEARLYSHGQHHAFLGRWVQDGVEAIFWAELEEVDHFKDEDVPAISNAG